MMMRRANQSIIPGTVVDSGMARAERRCDDGAAAVNPFDPIIIHPPPPSNQPMRTDVLRHLQFRLSTIASPSYVRIISPLEQK